MCLKCGTPIQVNIFLRYVRFVTISNNKMPFEPSISEVRGLRSKRVPNSLKGIRYMYKSKPKYAIGSYGNTKSHTPNQITKFSYYFLTYL